MSWTRGFTDAVKEMAEQNKPKVTSSGESASDVNNVFKLFKRASEGTISNYNDPFYSVSAEDWYKSYPYRFTISIQKKEESQSVDELNAEYIYYSLPIPPEALNYQMVSASQLIPTLGGVVEETSATVFWQITLSGTTGIGISRRYTEESDTLDTPAFQQENFRKVLKGGILANTYNKAAAATEAVTGAFGGGSPALGLLEGLASTAQRFNSSAVKTSIPSSDSLSKVTDFFNLDLSNFKKGQESTNGYVEIHLLHNFLNAYSHLKEKDTDEVSLYFESMKDNMKWKVIVKGFSFQKNANQPYLYRYNISLQGYQLTETLDVEREEVDRFGPDGDLQGVNSFTLSGALERAKSLERKISTNPLGLIATKPPII